MTLDDWNITPHGPSYPTGFVCDPDSMQVVAQAFMRHTLAYRDAQLAGRSPPAIAFTLEHAPESGSRIEPATSFLMCTPEQLQQIQLACPEAFLYESTASGESGDDADTDAKAE